MVNDPLNEVSISSGLVNCYHEWIEQWRTEIVNVLCFIMVSDLQGLCELWCSALEIVYNALFARGGKAMPFMHWEFEARTIKGRVAGDIQFFAFF